ncbi:hypothetical protein AC578_4530 [Pseudocercospora eumusae]|uniref:Uncharacterized protein n=1 Tax=Pseudocercospora eumusae TaxID=321146 RepID=A0A139HGK7_9PEZI|nr:hypothetical protein AC578_4530 [Pseudocercospora eumusae]
MSIDYKAIVEQGKATCTFPEELAYTEPYTGSWTFHKTISVISAILAGFTILICISNIMRHLNNFSCAVEQRQIVRIILTPIVFSICNLIGILKYDAAGYSKPVAELFEAIPLIGAFLLFIAFAVGASASRSGAVNAYFEDLPRRRMLGRNKLKHEFGSLRWFYLHYILVFQILPSRIALTIAEWAVHANACPLDEIPTGLSVSSAIVMVMWIVGTLRFYRRLRELLKPRNAYLKMFSFKLIVLVQIIQEPLLSGLLSSGILKPTEKVSYKDWKYGLPAFCVVVEMLLFSILFLFSFSAREYCHTGPDAEGLVIARQPELPFAKALVHSLDLSDILKGCFWHKQFIAVCFPEKAGLRRSKREEQDTEMLQPPPPGYVKDHTPDRDDASESPKMSGS